MFAFEQGWSADIPATLNTGSPSFGASLGLPVSKTSWHCCGFQANTIPWPQNKATGGPRWAFQKAGRLRQRPRGCRKDSLSTARKPAPCFAPGGTGRLTAALQVAPGSTGLGSRAQEVSLSLRQQKVPCPVGAASSAAAGPRPLVAPLWAA